MRDRTGCGQGNQSKNREPEERERLVCIGHSDWFLPQSWSTTLSNELLTLRGSSPSYSMKPSFLNLFRKKFTRERVVPTISASVVCEIFGTRRVGFACFPYRASSSSVRASRFSLELK